jgi:hypothetical protein
VNELVELQAPHNTSTALAFGARRIGRATLKKSRPIIIAVAQFHRSARTALNRAPMTGHDHQARWIFNVWKNGLQIVLFVKIYSD